MSQDSLQTRRGLSLDHVYVFSALALIAMRPLLMRIPPYDFWWQMAMGRRIALEGHVPTTDAFSYTRPGQPFYDQSWLAQRVLYELHRLGGLELIVAAQACVVALAYGLLLWLTIRRTGNTRLSVVLLLLGTVPLSLNNWIVRPQSYALPLFAAFFLILTVYRLRWWRGLWLLPLLMVLWVNLHGSFFLGLGLIGFTLLGEGVRRWRGDEEALSWPECRNLALWGVLTALCILLNPRGTGVIDYVRFMLTAPSNKISIEWDSPTVKSPEGMIFFLFVIALFLVLLYARRRPCPTDLVIMLVFFCLALQSRRYIIWFAMVALPVLALAISSWLESRREDVPPTRVQTVMNGILMGLISLMVVLCLPWFKHVLPLPPHMAQIIGPDTPVNAVAVLRLLPEGRPHRLYHAEGAGSYLTWAAPEQKVFIDARFEFYPEQQWRDSIKLTNGCDVDELLDKYHIDGLLIEPDKQKDLLARIKRNKRWHIIYQGVDGVLVVRAGAS